MILHRKLRRLTQLGRRCPLEHVPFFVHGKRSHLPLLASLGFFVLSLGGGVAAPQSLSHTGCVPTERLQRDDNENRLAVEQDGGWLICQSNTPATAYEIDINPGSDLHFRWGAPKSSSREVVYISTIAKANHPLSLQRNSAAGVLGMFVPFVGEDWEYDFHAGQKQNFVHYHVPEIAPDEPLAPEDEFRRSLDRWHNTGLWFANKDTDEVVRSALLDEDVDVMQRGAERLIRLQARRPRTSWIGFISQRPSRGGILRILISYSGQRGNHRYYFRDKD